MSPIQDIRSALQHAEHTIRTRLPALTKNDLAAVVNDAERLLELISSAVAALKGPGQEEP